MPENINLFNVKAILFFFLGGIVSWGYYSLLYKTLQMVKNFKNKGLFLFLSTLVRLALFVILTLIITQRQMDRLIWYIVGFMVVRLCVIYYLKREKTNG